MNILHRDITKNVAKATKPAFENGLIQNRVLINISTIESALEAGQLQDIMYLLKHGARVDNSDLLKEKLLCKLSGYREGLELILKAFRIPENKLYIIFKNVFFKGNFDLASKIYTILDTCFESNIITDTASAIVKGLGSSIENNKYHAIVNLINKAGISIPERYQYLVNNIRDDIQPEEFRFIHDYINKLAVHYINLSKARFRQSLSMEPELADKTKEVKQLLDNAFKLNNYNRFDSFIRLKEIFPNYNELKKITNEFDAYYMVVGNALNQLDKDFALEVLALNGVNVPPLQEPLTVFRGYVAIMDDESIYNLFKYGTRSFGIGEVQKILSYYVRESWNQINFQSWHFWQYGGTYASLEPYTAAAYSSGETAKMKGDSFLLEIKLNQGSPKICGDYKSAYELVPSSIDSSEIIAVYKLNNYKVQSVYLNPYLKNSSFEACYKVGDLITQDDQAIASYLSLNCESVKYDNYNDFINKYSYQEEILKVYFEDRPLYSGSDENI